MMGASPQGGSASKSGGIFGGLFGPGFGKNIAKLGIIAVGVGSIVGMVKKLTSLVVDASPMLQAMFKLFNFSLMLIFRPIGDFIGFLLRPIILMFLRFFVLPWYRTMLPTAIRMGNIIGNTVAPVLQSLFEFLGGIGDIIAGVFTFDLARFNRGLTTISDMIGLNIGKQEEGIHQIINVKDAVKDAGTTISNTVGSLKDSIGGKVEAALHRLASVPGFAGAGEAMRGIMTKFGQVTGQLTGKYGLNLMQRLLGGGQNALRLIGAAQTGIQADISAGAFGNITEALHAYISRILSFKREGRQVAGNQTFSNSGNTNFNFYGTVIGKDELERTIVEVMEKQYSKRSFAPGV